jgi:type I restriction enzyme S subunit
MLNKTTTPAGWKAVKLGDTGKVSMCKRILKNQTKTHGDIPFFKIGTFGKKPDAFISKKIYDEYKKKYSFPKKGEILISASGTIGRTVVYDGSHGYFQDSNIVWLSNNEKKVTNSFLAQAYKRVRWQTASGTIARLYNENIREIKISAPPLPEQKKIVKILETWDTYLEKLSKKIKLKKKLKKGLMRKLLTGKVRLMGFSEPWKIAKLGDCLKIKHGKSQKAVENPNGQYPILGTGGEMGRSTAFLYNKPSVLIGRKGTIDKPKYMETPFWTVDTLFYSEVKDNCNPKYLYYHFLIINWKQYNEGSGIPSLSASTISSIQIEIPESKNEQIEIAKILTTADSEIDTLEKKRKLIEQQKKFLLNNLITGKIRFPEFQS